MPAPLHAEIVMISANPEIYCLVVHGETVGQGSYEEMFQLGDEYDSFYEPEKSWQQLGDVDPDEYWARRRKREENCHAVRRQAEARQRAEQRRAELRRTYYAAVPAPQPIRTERADLKLVKGSDSSSNRP